MVTRPGEVSVCGWRNEIYNKNGSQNGYYLSMSLTLVVSNPELNFLLDMCVLLCHLPTPNRTLLSSRDFHSLRKLINWGLYDEEHSGNLHEI